MKKCDRCDEDIEFERTKRGYRPTNLDGSDHFKTCKKTKKTDPAKRIKDLDRRLMRGYYDDELGVSYRNF